MVYVIPIIINIYFSFIINWGFGVLGFWGLRGGKGQPQDIEPSTGSVEREKMAKRADMKKVPEINPQEAVQKIFNKVRPVLKTLANQALGQINSRSRRYIDGGNFEGAAKVAASGTKLQQFLAAIDTTGEISLNGDLGTQIRRAIAKASGSGQYTPEYNEFLKNAATGNTAALKPILDSLRDSLVELS